MEWGKYKLDLEERTFIMGVLNVTPDSFSDGGIFFNREKAIEHGIEMVEQGADIIDIGGESTRPYAEKVSLQEEMDRVIPIIEGLSKEIPVPISIDTYKSKVAKEALEAGASILNDISALGFDPEFVRVAASFNVPLILMHMKGTPGNMQNSPVYDDLLGEIIQFLEEAVNKAVAGGVKKEMIIVDPGIGFGKTFENNVELLRDLDKLKVLGCPVLLGSSRKAFIGHILNKEPDDRDIGTMATVSAGVLKGAQIVRVHDVEKAVDTVKIIDCIKRGKIS